MMDTLTVVSHPLVRHTLTVLRDRTTSTAVFRKALRDCAALLGYEATRDLPLEMRAIETPLMPMRSPVLAAKRIVIAPILRAGLGMVDGLLELMPDATVAHLGLYRDPASLRAVDYYFKASAELADCLVMVLDPMLATGNTAVAALDRLKEGGARDLRFLCVLAAPAGIDQLRRHHPDVRLWTAAIDDELNDHGYILPGLGDAGDRMCGT